MTSEPITLIKVGTGVLTKESNGKLDGSALVRLVSAIAQLIHSGVKCVFVSSGAVGSGLQALGLNEYPKDTATRQACAAVGQARLMESYSKLFENFEINVAQVLLTYDDFTTEKRLDCIQNVLTRLLSEPHVLPIINENDCVAVDELKFGDNDMLSAKVAKLLNAERMILLTTVDGVLNPTTQELIPQVNNLDDIEQYISSDKGKFSMGGMMSKLKAVRYATEAGIETYIANGRHPERLVDIVHNTSVATHFTIPHKK